MLIVPEPQPATRTPMRALGWLDKFIRLGMGHYIILYKMLDKLHNII